MEEDVVVEVKKRRGRKKLLVPTVMIAFRVPKYLIDEIDRLVDTGKYASRADAIKYAIRLLIEKEKVGQE